jgi:hypothetical protein
VIARPTPTEYAPYYESYVARVPRGDILEHLARGIDDTMRLLENVDEDTALIRYAQGKWSVKGVVGHVCDTERVYSYRALRFARGDATALPGFDQDDYVSRGSFDSRPLGEILDELRAVRAASIALFAGLAPEAFARTGKANGLDFTVRAIPFIIAGHELHHVGVITERYLPLRRQPGTRA